MIAELGGIITLNVLGQVLNEKCLTVNPILSHLHLGKPSAFILAPDLSNWKALVQMDWKQFQKGHQQITFCQLYCTRKEAVNYISCKQWLDLMQAVNWICWQEHILSVSCSKLYLLTAVSCICWKQWIAFVDIRAWRRCWNRRGARWSQFPTFFWLKMNRLFIFLLIRS